MSDDKQIWLEAMQGVAPLKSDGKVTQKSPKNFSKKISVREETSPPAMHFYDNDVDQPEYMFFARSGLQHRLQQQLRTGKIKSEALLDLHGLTVDEARMAVAEFLSKSYTHKLRSVMIIHGKGYTRGSILRNKVYQWLPQCTFVLAFCSATINDGGAGAVYVLLRR